MKIVDLGSVVNLKPNVDQVSLVDVNSVALDDLKPEIMVVFW